MISIGLPRTLPPKSAAAICAASSEPAPFRSEYWPDMSVSPPILTTSLLTWAAAWPATANEPRQSAAAIPRRSLEGVCCMIYPLLSAPPFRAGFGPVLFHFPGWRSFTSKRLGSFLRRNGHLAKHRGCRRRCSMLAVPEFDQLADDAAAEGEHADHEDEAVDDGDPLSECRQIVLHGDDDEGADERAVERADAAEKRHQQHFAGHKPV